MADSKLVKVGGLWIKEGKNGKYMHGPIDAAIPAGARLFVFKNGFKETEKHPDYVLQYAPPEDPPGSDAPLKAKGLQIKPEELEGDDCPF